MYELIILSLLMRSPMHGYLLAKVTNDKIGPWARVSNGTLYPLLARLERDGYISAGADGENTRMEHGEAGREAQAHAPTADRPCRAYSVTEKGRERFHALMLDTNANLSDYQRVFRQKVPSLHLLTVAERTYLLDHYQSYCETTTLYYEREARDLERKLAAATCDTTTEAGGGASWPGYVDEVQGEVQVIAWESAIEVLGRQVEEWRAELAWAQHLRGRVASGPRAHVVDGRDAATRASWPVPRKRGTGGTPEGERDAGTPQGGDEHAHA